MRKILVCLLVVIVRSSGTKNTPIELIPNTNESGIDVAKFNSFVTQYFFHHFGENGLKYLSDTISARPIKCPQWYTDSILRGEVDAIVRAFDVPVGFFQSLVVKHKTTSEYRYRVHRVVGMLDYMINHNCAPLNSWKMYHDQVMLRDSMTGKIREFASIVNDKERKRGSDLAESYWRKIVRHCLMLIGRLVWIPSEENPDSGLFKVITFTIQRANNWCSRQLHVGNCATIYYLLSRRSTTPDPRQMLSIQFAQEGFFDIYNDSIAKRLYALESIHTPPPGNKRCNKVRDIYLDRQAGDLCRFIRQSFLLASRDDWFVIRDRFNGWFDVNKKRIEAITTCALGNFADDFLRQIDLFFYNVFGREDSPRQFEHPDSASLRDLAAIHSRNDK